MFRAPHTRTPHTPVAPAGPRRHRIGRRAGVAALHMATVALLLPVPTAAFADSTGPVYLAAKTLPEVITGLQAWIMGILAAVATLFLVLAVLAPVLLEVVKGIVGG